MVFGQEKLLTSEQEERFIKYLRWAWEEEGQTANQIAVQLRFGKAGTKYERLKKRHIYFYVKKYGLKKDKVSTDKPTQQINPMFENFYTKWTPTMPECVADNLRKEGFLLNEP